MQILESYSGVLQDSIPGLTNIYTADRPKSAKYQIAQYAEDTVLYTSNGRKDHTHKHL